MPYQRQESRIDTRRNTVKNIELTNLLRKMRTAYAMAEAPTLGLVVGLHNNITKGE